MIDKICIILLANILFFAKTLSYGYTSDDLPVKQRSDSLEMPWYKRRFFQIEGGVRVNPQEDHMITAFIHAITCVMVYIAFGANDISFLAAILFAFNPINNQGSVWISGRTYPITAILLMVAMCVPWIAPLAILLAMHYPIGFILSSILIAWSPWLVLPIGLSALWHFKHVKSLVKCKTDHEMFAEDKKVSWFKVTYVLKTLGFYTTHALFPIKTTFYHSYMQSLAGSGKDKAKKIDRFFFIGIIVIAIILAKFLLTPWDMVSFGLLWWIVGIAPYLNAFRISQEIAERYAYIPNIGLMFVLSSLIWHSPALSAMFIAMYATKLWFYMDAYQDEYYLVEHATLNSPDSWFAWHVKALKRWDVKSYKEAIIMWTMAKMISPREFKVLFNLATMLAVVGEMKEAKSLLKEAEKCVPEGQEVKSFELINNWRNGKYAVLV